MALQEGFELDGLPDGPDGYGSTQGGFYPGADGLDYEFGYEAGYAQGVADASPAIGIGTFFGGFFGGAAGGSGETDAPVGTPVSPDTNEPPGDPGAFPAAYATAKDTPIVYTVVDAESSIAFVSIGVKYSDRDHTEEVYSGRPIIDGVAGFVAPYISHSSISGDGTAGVGCTFSIRRDDGWPGQRSTTTVIELRVRAVDASGNVVIA